MLQGKWVVPAAIILSLVLVGLAFVYRAGVSAVPAQTGFLLPSGSSDDIFRSIAWDDLEEQLVEAGVIDAAQRARAGTKLNLLWAFGLANANPILTEGPMMDPRYGGAANFASTGGWTLARGSAMDHYAAHRFVTLTKEEQVLVERVSKNIYRPCCGNSTYFPDCNHGMAMLGLLELMAAGGADERAMYRAALAVNSEWFPDTYDAIRRHFAARGVASENIDPKVALGPEFSSAEGYARVLAEVEPSPASGGGSCGV
ncbi:MAG: hypothetical protein Q8P88_02960 [Candidatus Jorgensenbacteria bacterium]|nr:hypothetical protein [Candidatus Jorgensenbacteria bacterium]